MTERHERILITGGSGFIGAYVARDLLAAGRTVVDLDLAPPSPVARHILGDHADAYRYEPGGVEDWGRIVEVVRRHEVDAIVHGAAIVDVKRLRTDPLPAVRVNFGGTVNVLEAARVLGVSRVLLISSIGALPTVQQEPIPVDHPLVLAREGSGSGFYGAAKVASESFGMAYVTGFGLDFRSVRPSAPYGLGMGWPMFVKTMVEGAVRGIPVRFASGGRYPRAYTHIEDVASLIVAVLDAPADADRIFYGSNGGRLVTASEVASIVRELEPSADIEIGEELAESDRFELNIRARLSVDNAREQLGWSPRYLEMRDGVAQYLERYRAFLAATEPGALR
jgi:nucleoside-diphosphate-sugar epimerase